MSEHPNATTSDRADQRRSDEQPILEIADVSKQFGGVSALDDANMTVRKGEIVGLVGPNGAGKSTLFNCIMGTHLLSSGTITFDGENISTLSTSKIVQRGVSRVYQQARVFPELTVRENMIVNQNHADESRLATTFRPSDDATTAFIDEMLEFVDLEELANEPAAEMSTGQKKLLGIASSLIRSPGIVLLDEPTAGVNPNLMDDIADTILELNDDGWTFLIIEHDMDVIKRLSDHLYFLHNGSVLTEGRPTEVLQDDRVLEAYFGE
jgi:branched-chain amino acid transport system ATP-binding protein